MRNDHALALAVDARRTAARATTPARRPVRDGGGRAHRQPIVSGRADRHCAPCTDVGKGLRLERLLLKPVPLTEAEFSLVQRHSEEGERDSAPSAWTNRRRHSPPPRALGWQRLPGRPSRRGIPPPAADHRAAYVDGRDDDGSCLSPARPGHPGATRAGGEPVRIRRLRAVWSSCQRLNLDPVLAQLGRDLIRDLPRLHTASSTPRATERILQALFAGGDADAALPPRSPSPPRSDQ